MDEEPHRYSWPLLTSKSFTLSHFRSSAPLPPLFLSRAVSLFLTLRQLYRIEGELSCSVCVCGSCAASVTGAVCMRESDSVWSNHCNCSHGHQPSFLNPCHPPSLLSPSPPSFLQFLPWSVSTHMSLPHFLPSHNPTIPKSYHRGLGKTLSAGYQACPFTLTSQLVFINMCIVPYYSISNYDSQRLDNRVIYPCYCNWGTFYSSPSNLALVCFDFDIIQQSFERKWNEMKELESAVIIKTAFAPIFF